MSENTNRCIETWRKIFPSNYYFSHFIEIIYVIMSVCKGKEKTRIKFSTACICQNSEHIHVHAWFFSCCCSGKWLGVRVLLAKPGFELFLYFVGWGHSLGQRIGLEWISHWWHLAYTILHGWNQCVRCLMALRLCDAEMLKLNCMVRWVVQLVVGWFVMCVGYQGYGNSDKGGLEWALTDNQVEHLCWILVKWKINKMRSWWGWQGWPGARWWWCQGVRNHGG